MCVYVYVGVFWCISVYFCVCMCISVYVYVFWCIYVYVCVAFRLVAAGWRMMKPFVKPAFLLSGPSPAHSRGQKPPSLGVSSAPPRYGRPRAGRGGGQLARRRRSRQASAAGRSGALPWHSASVIRGSFHFTLWSDSLLLALGPRVLSLHTRGRQCFPAGRPLALRCKSPKMPRFSFLLSK